MSPRTLPSPQAPDERGTHEGRPYWLWLPTTPGPWPGMVILHGAGSRKENHADFARMCRAAGWAALTYDMRGHGDATDEMGPAALADVGRMAAFLGARDGVADRRISVRGSSMGGFFAIHAAATSDSIRGAIAICPAPEDGLARALRRGELDFRISPEGSGGMGAWLGELDLRDAVELMGEKPLILLHADGDERVPSEGSRELYSRASEPRKLVIVPGGHHRSVQHDAELQSVALRWLTRNL